MWLRICRLRLSLGVSSSSFAAVIWERSVGSIGDLAQRCPLVGSYHVWPEAGPERGYQAVARALRVVGRTPPWHPPATRTVQAAPPRDGLRPPTANAPPPTR